jgi:hypothetical protein
MHSSEVQSAFGTRHSSLVTRIKNYTRHWLSGDELGLYARMGAVCDVYDAITSDHPCKEGWCPTNSLRHGRMGPRRAIQRGRVCWLVKCLGIYPVSTLVHLHSGASASRNSPAANHCCCPGSRCFSRHGAQA